MADRAVRDAGALRELTLSRFRIVVGQLPDRLDGRHADAERATGSRRDHFRFRLLLLPLPGGSSFRFPALGFRPRFRFRLRLLLADGQVGLRLLALTLGPLPRLLQPEALTSSRFRLFVLPGGSYFRFRSCGSFRFRLLPGGSYFRFRFR